MVKLNLLNSKKIILASQSPRRKELLSELGFQFETLSLDVDETFPNDLPASEIAAYLSCLKADSYTLLKENELLITADTIVVYQDKILGKPANKEEAKEMILGLSGKIHQVYTSFTIRDLYKSKTLTDVANVEFSEISGYEADFYIENFQPMDKAGAYGIQEWLGMAKIKSINGSFYTIMGLPTHLIYNELINW